MARRAFKLPAPPPVKFPRGYLDRFSAEIEPLVAVKVAEYVNSYARDRKRGWNVNGCIIAIAAELHVCERKAWEVLAAGDWLLQRRPQWVKNRR